MFVIWGEYHSLRLQTASNSQMTSQRISTLKSTLRSKKWYKDTFAPGPFLVHLLRNCRVFWMKRRTRALFGVTPQAWYFPPVARAHHSSPKHLTLSRAAMVSGRRDPPRSSSYFLETGPETSQLPLSGKPTNKEVGRNCLHHVIFGTILTVMLSMQGLSKILCN